MSTESETPARSDGYGVRHGFRGAYQAATNCGMEKLLASDPQLARDLVDIALINERRAEPSRTLSSYLKKRRVQRG